LNIFWLASGWVENVKSWFEAQAACDWNLKNFKAGLELFNRIAVVAETEKHHTDLHLESYNRVRMEIWTTLSMCPPLKCLIFRLLSMLLPPTLFHHLHIMFDCYDALLNHSEVVVISGHHVYLWYSYSSCSSWNYLHFIFLLFVLLLICVSVSFVFVPF
jgi:hypothetical protein